MNSYSTPRFWSRANWEAYLFLAPWFVGFILFLAFPIGYSLFLSLCRWDLISPEPEFVGMANYIKIATGDPRFWHSLKVTFLYAMGSVPLCLALAMFLALLLNQRFRGMDVFRTVYYLPSVVSGVAVAVLWMGLLNPEFGIINKLLHPFYELMGLGPGDMPKWLFSQRWALRALIIMALWGVGPSCLVFLAGLQSIPHEFHEAAMIDGAGRFQRFLHVTLPFLTPMILFNLIIGIIGSLQVFTQGFIMTGGGPRDATLFYVLYIWQKAFVDFQAGYASALAWILFWVILALTMLVMYSSRMWVHYSAEENP